MTGSTRTRLLAPLVLLLAGAVFCGVLLQILAPDHDNAFHLEIAARILGGGRYFFDFMELNPPLYPVLMVPVHGLRALTGFDLYSAFIIWISAAIVASSIAVWSQLADCLDEGLFGRTVVTLGVEAVLFFTPGMEFGQRDHLAIVLILPFLPWLAAGRSGQPVTVTVVAITIAAGIGLLIKPFLLFVLVLPYTVRLLEERNWRVLIEPPVWLLAIVAGLYVGLILIVFPEWLLVARIARVAYAAYDAAAWISRRVVLTMAVIVVLAIANEAFAWTNRRERKLGRMLAAGATGALASHVLQHKDIGYQFIPAWILLGLLAGMVALVAAQWAEAAPLPGWLRAWGRVVCRHRAIAVCLIAAIPLSRNVDKAMIDSRRMDASMRSLAALLNANHVGPRVAVFGASAYPAYPLSLYRETLPAWRFPQPWIVPWIVQQHEAGLGDAPQTVQIETELRALVREDFLRFRPDGIVVDESPNQIALPPGFDMMAWFRQDPEMAAILDGYERVSQFRDPDDRRWAFTSLALYRRRAG